MIFKEYKPSISLLPYIETYWIAKGYAKTKEIDKIFPDGCVDIIFSFNQMPNNGALVPYLPNLIGTMTTFSEISYYQNISMLGIRFKPAGITAFTKIPINYFTDSKTDLTLIDTLFEEKFYAKLPELETSIAKIKHIDLYLNQRLISIFELNNQIVFATELIKKTNGRLPLIDIANRSCLSLRNFERKFKTAVGISPKTFSKIIKFKHTLSYIKKNPTESLFSIAVDCGYYDHSHLIKDFKTFTGNTPLHL